MTDYTPYNPSIKRHNCQEPSGALCNQPARPDPYRVRGLLMWLCDEHALDHLFPLVDADPSVWPDINKIEKKKAVTGWSEVIAHPDFDYITRNLPMSTDDVHKFGARMQVLVLEVS